MEERKDDEVDETKKYPTRVERDIMHGGVGLEVTRKQNVATRKWKKPPMGQKRRRVEGRVYSGRMG